MNGPQATWGVHSSECALGVLLGTAALSVSANKGCHSKKQPQHLSDKSAPFLSAHSWTTLLNHLNSPQPGGATRSQAACIFQCRISVQGLLHEPGKKERAGLAPALMHSALTQNDRVALPPPRRGCSTGSWELGRKEVRT